MTPIEILLSALALAFCWVEFINPFKKTKPFNCTMCMSGWFAGSLALFAGYQISTILFIACGVFIGALFEAIKMRWM